jgi:hypothetical protein
MKNALELLEKKLASHIEDAQKRQKAAKKSKIEYYFSGQGDAFTQALLELRVLKYDLALPEQDDEIVLVEESVVVDDTSPVEPESDSPAEISDDARPARKKRRKAAKAKPKELSPAMQAAQELFQQALAAGVIEQKISLYFHEDFPNGKLRGRIPVMEFLTDEAMAGKITQQIAEQQIAPDVAA